MRSMVVTSQESGAMLDDDFETRLANMAEREEEVGKSATAGRDRPVHKGRRVLSQSTNDVGNASKVGGGLRSSSRNREHHGNVQGLRRSTGMGSRDNLRQMSDKGSQDNLHSLAKSTTEEAPLDGQMLLARSGAPRNGNRRQGAAMRSMVVTSQESGAMLDDDFETRLANMAEREEEVGKSATAGRDRPVHKGRRVLSQSTNDVGNASKVGGGLRSSSRNREHHGNVQGLRRSTGMGSRDNLRQMSDKGSQDNLHSLAKSTTKEKPPDGQMLLARSGTRKVRRGRVGDHTKPLSHSDTSIKKVSRSRSRSGAMGKSMII